MVAEVIVAAAQRQLLGYGFQVRISRSPVHGPIRIHLPTADQIHHIFSIEQSEKNTLVSGLFHHPIAFLLSRQPVHATVCTKQ